MAESLEINVGNKSLRCKVKSVVFREDLAGLSNQTVPAKNHILGGLQCAGIGVYVAGEVTGAGHAY